MNDTQAAAGHGVFRLPSDRVSEAVHVLCDAFHDYPVMRYILGPRSEDYDRCLHRMIGIFVSARALRGDPILAVADGAAIVGVATLTPPGDRQAPPSVAEAREALWRDLDPGAKARSDALVAIWDRTTLSVPQWHLNMLGVVGTHAGRGVGSRLLKEVHRISREDAGSTGVSLTTEDPANVPLYQHCGYEIVSHDRVSPELETWGFFRKDGP